MINTLQDLKNKIQAILPNWTVHLGANLQDTITKTIYIPDTYTIDIITDTGFNVNLNVFGYAKEFSEADNGLIMLITKLHKKIVNNNMLFIKQASIERNNDFWIFSILLNFIVVFR